MKRELAFALEVQSKCGSIGRTRSGKTWTLTPDETTDCNGVSENESNKKLKTLNDESEGNDSSDNMLESKGRWDGVIHYSRSKRQIRSEEPKNDGREEEREIDLHETVILVEEKPTCSGDLVGPVCVEETKSSSQEVLIKEEPTDGGPKLIDESKETDISAKEKLPRRFTRSVLIFKEDNVESSESDSKFCDSVAIGVDEMTNAGLRSLTSPKKLELKMSKKIALSKVPLSIRDLLETGMLEGLSVTYNGRKKVYRFIPNGVYLTKLIVIN